MKKLLYGLLIASALAADVSQSEAAGVRAITGAGYVDVLTGQAVPDAVVVIKNGRIAEIGAVGKVTVPADAERINLPGKWLLPGLMNMHVHLGLFLPGALAAEHADESESQLALRMAENARRSLLSGVTTIRTTGDMHHADIALANAVNRGWLPGPRIISSGEIVTITGGHGAGAKLRNDGTEEIRKATRNELRAGARWIKIAITGGIATPGGGVAQGLMTPDEIQAAVDVAKRQGVSVTAHSGSAAATREAVELGVRGIEHGYFLDRQVLKLMHDREVWFVPTIIVSQPATFEFFKRVGAPQWYMDRVREVGKDHWQALKMAIEEKVNIAVGSDQFPFEPNDGTTATIREAEYYVEAGMTPLQGLQAATIQPARMLGMDAQIGSLSAGKFADIVAVDSNPLVKFSSLRSLGFVMKQGYVYRNDWDQAAQVSPLPPVESSDPAFQIEGGYDDPF